MLIVAQVRRCSCKAWLVGSAISPSPPHASKLAHTSLKVLQETNKQLHAELTATAWPRLVSLTLNRQKYVLPLHAEHKAETGLVQLTLQQLAYLAGVFDGDGCVQSRRGWSLRVAQSLDGVGILMCMQQALGGSIYRLSDGKGLRKPCLQWILSGSRARHAAKTLAPYSIVKRRQLELLSEWPQAHADKADCAIRLGFLKHRESAVPGRCSWAYLAGFFDAEGCIEQHRGKAALVLRISQKHPTVLECLQHFLARELDVQAQVYYGSRSQCHDLRINKTSSSKAVLQKLLDSGLIRKAAQANLALGLTLENAEEVRNAMASMVGNQGCLNRLDGAGLQRATMISFAQKKAKQALKKGHTSLAESLFAEVEHQKCEHELLNAWRVHSQLQAHIKEIRSMYQNAGAYTL